MNAQPSNTAAQPTSPRVWLIYRVFFVITLANTAGLFTRAYKPPVPLNPILFALVFAIIVPFTQRAISLSYMRRCWGFLLLYTLVGMVGPAPRRRRLYHRAEQRKDVYRAHRHPVAVAARRRQRRKAAHTRKARRIRRGARRSVHRWFSWFARPRWLCCNRRGSCVPAASGLTPITPRRRSPSSCYIACCDLCRRCVPLLFRPCARRWHLRHLQSHADGSVRRHRGTSAAAVARLQAGCRQRYRAGTAGSRDCFQHRRVHIRSAPPPCARLPVLRPATPTSSRMNGPGCTFGPRPCERSYPSTGCSVVGTAACIRIVEFGARSEPAQLLRLDLWERGPDPVACIHLPLTSDVAHGARGYRLGHPGGADLRDRLLRYRKPLQPRAAVRAVGGAAVLAFRPDVRSRSARGLAGRQRR